jgi:signal transduction histidine kinase
LAGPDKGKGGKFVVLPPGYQGNVPDGYFTFCSFPATVYWESEILMNKRCAGNTVEASLTSAIKGAAQSYLGAARAGRFCRVPKYDWRQLQRWNISESRLPPGSEILFREPTVWERYSWQIASIVAVVLIQAGLIAIMLQEHRRRQFAEVQSRQRMTELAHVNRFATAGELTASIAHEINQPLGSILANAETAEAILKS